MMEQSWIPYCGAAPLPGDWLARWNGDPILLLAFAAVALVAWQRMEVAASFWAGLAILVLLFVSPLCALSSALFSVRVGHHVLLTARSEERRVGKACVSTCRSRWSRYP